MLSPVSRLQRTAFFCLVYGALATLSLWLAYELRFSPLHSTPTETDRTAFQEYLFFQRPRALLWLVPLKVGCLWAFGQFRGVFYYFRLPDALRLGSALFLATLVALFIPALATEGGARDLWAPTRGVILMDFNLSLILFVGFRVSLRALRDRFFTAGNPTQGVVERIAIIGAGQVGAQLAADLLARRGHGLEPVCFLDDNPDKHRLNIHGIPVVGAPARIPELAEKFGVTEIILALPAQSARRIREVSVLAAAHQLRVLVVPSLTELAGGRVQASDLRPVSVEDLLGRSPAQLDATAIGAMIAGQTVLVTGAGGSIGAELCRQIAQRAPARLLLLDQCEPLLYQTEQELISQGAGALVTPLVADIGDEAAMRRVFGQYQPTLIIHAAAHKHVPMMESQPTEALQNNVLGTANLAQLASEFGATKFVLISSDKAINPTNVMGATKRLAELVVRAMQAQPGNRTTFVAVRFGNVLASSGSVIPIFRKQIAQGGPVTVTHPDVKRYFMTIPEAVGLVLQSATLGGDGEILVLEMGEPLRIMDVARQLIELSGLRPDVDIEIRITGLRPGEKLVEELHHAGEHFRPTAHPRVFCYLQPLPSPGELPVLLAQVKALLPLDRQPCKLGIRTLVPEYIPFTD